MNNNSKCDMNLFSCECVTRYTNQDCSKGPVYLLNSVSFGQRHALVSKASLHNFNSRSDGFDAIF